ncbi:hypothetical protein [Actinocatenispora rupis]|uniref:Small secreted protein n=1 Tax=Actinocatenispora rupis TaxID=519421 RepID=A0A8J3NBU5_9ACTN|nr:hypothetical protein [Actinocatenispora rupis]GID13714.1 hypothetical protein Aru02nite_46030 [Actinocatenispora rupis]
MRQTVTRGVVALAAVAAIGLVSGCSSANKDACKSIQNDLKSYSSSAGTDDPGKGIKDLAGKIRDDAKGADGDVKSAANAFADDLDSLADSMGGTSAPDTSSMSSDAQKLGSACGTSMSIPGM